VRSVSRVGKSDLGTNARRIQEYLSKIIRSVSWARCWITAWLHHPITLCTHRGC